MLKNQVMLEACLGELCMLLHAVALWNELVTIVEQLLKHLKTFVVFFLCCREVLN